MNKLKTTLLLIITAATLGSCELGRCVVYNIPDVKDYRIFPSRRAVSDSVKFSFASADNKDLGSALNVKLNNDQEVTLDSFLNEKGTLAFLIIQHDTIRYEKYFNNCDQSSVVPSFSVAKSVTSTLIGCAIADGLIKSIDQPITDFLPEMKPNGFEKVKIRHLLQMTSGINFKEGFFHFSSSTAEFYYGINLREKACALKLKAQPGTRFEYASGNAELLGLILERALKTKTVTQYLQEKIWQPLGMEYDATWSLDRERDGLEKTFCCLNARARDYAKIGRLFMHKGQWNGQQIVPEEWVNACTTPDTTEGSAWFYQHQWWLASDEGDFYARGMLGQFVYVNPGNDMIIVRLGERGARVDWPVMFREITKKLKEDPKEELYITEAKVN